MVFDEYAQYYDLLYKDKDYVGEALYIDSLIKKYNPDAKQILDLGCGTGKHAELLAQHGYIVHGVDMSRNMLQKAYIRASKNKNLSFSMSNIQDFELNKKYDTITALFHVMSYQTTDEVMEKVLEKVYTHLNKNGIFIFDCWYGPAVLMERPELRVKRLQNENIRITRIAEPVLKENENIVEVHYDVFIENKASLEIKELKETHIMRYFFKQELEKLVKKCGFTYTDDFEFMTNNPIDKTTWGSCFVIRK